MMLMRLPIVAAAVAAAFAPRSLAQGLGPEHLPADTAFVVHVDLEQISNLVGLDRLLEDFIEEEGEQVRDVLRHVRRDWGFDPLRDIHSVTVFGPDVDVDDHHFIVVTSDRLDGVVDALRDHRALVASERDGIRFHRLSAEGLFDALDVEERDVDSEDSAAMSVHEIDRDHRAIVVAERLADIAKPTRVLQGDARSLADARDPRLRFRPARGTLAYAEITSFEEFLDRSPASRVADKVRRVAVELSAEQDLLRLRATADTESKRDAQDVAAIVNGLRGLLSLSGMAEELPEIVRDLSADARVGADGKQVVVRVSVPIDALRSLIEDETGMRIPMRRRGDREHDRETESKRKSDRRSDRRGRRRDH